MKKQIAEKYGVPLTENNPNKTVHLQVKEVNKIACTLHKAGTKVPQEKLE